MTAGRLPIARGLPRWRRVGEHAPALGLGVLIALGILLEGALIARGSTLAYVAIGVVAVAIGSMVFAQYLWEALLVWTAIEAVAFPFLRWPLNHNLLTFDRYVILALGGALLLTRGPRMAPRSRRLVFAFGAFTVIFGVRALVTDALPLPRGRLASSDLQPQIDWLDNVLLPFVVFVVAARTVTPERWNQLARALTILGATSAAVALLQWGLGFELATIAGYEPFVDATAGVVRAGGPYPDPSVFGGVMVVCLAATVYWMQRNRAYALGSAVIALELVSLIPTFTKTVWGAGFVATIIALGLRQKMTSRLVLVSFYAVTLLGVIYTIVSKSPVIAARVTSQASSDNLSGRFATWEQALHIVQQWPLFGAGVDQYISAQSLVAPVYVRGVAAVSSPHNTFLLVMAETGLIGFAAMLLLIAAAVSVMRACARYAATEEDVLFRATLVGAVVGYLLLSVTFAELYETPATTFFALMIGAAAARVNHMQQRRTRETSVVQGTVRRRTASDSVVP
jgi:O-antigen ligase